MFVQEYQPRAVSNTAINIYLVMLLCVCTAHADDARPAQIGSTGDQLFVEFRFAVPGIWI